MPDPVWGIVIADDHPIVLQGVARVISEAPGFRVLGQAQTAEQCLAVVDDTQPDALVLDLRLGDTVACDICAAVKLRAPRTKIVIFTAFDGDLELLDSCLRNGASSVLIKDAHQLDLVRALREVLKGNDVIDSRVARRAEGTAGYGDGNGPEYDRLSPREHEVIRLLALGMTSKEIAESLHLSPNTVRSYNQSILAKLRSKNRVQALATARRLRLI
jgi:DNA-binding NarL/FixJ family response regulator